MKKLTPFEVAQQQAIEGILQMPTVSTANGEVPYWGYQLAVHKFNLSIMASGMKCRGITFTQIKKYYGLEGKSAKECVPQLVAILDAYKENLKIK